jgi:hypothetical protein
MAFMQIVNFYIFAKMLFRHTKLNKLLQGLKDNSLQLKENFVIARKSLGPK